MNYKDFKVGKLYRVTESELQFFSPNISGESIAEIMCDWTVSWESRTTRVILEKGDILCYLEKIVTPCRSSGGERIYLKFLLPNGKTAWACEVEIEETEARDITYLEEVERQ